MSQFKILGRIGLFLIGITYFTKEFIIPEVSYQLNKDEFMLLTTQCGLAMDSNWYIAQESEESIRKSSEIQLLVCHDYDKLRKKMLDRGVTEYRLTGLSLLALEIHQKPIRELTEAHKFRER